MAAAVSFHASVKKGVIHRVASGHCAISEAVLVILMAGRKAYWEHERLSTLSHMSHRAVRKSRSCFSGHALLRF